MYPDIGLKDARERRDEYRKLLANGIDPSEQRKATKTASQDRASNSFELIAREWLVKYSNRWTEGHKHRILRRLECDIFPWLGQMPISEITAPKLLATIRRIEQRGALETAHRVLNSCGQIFRYAIATGRAERDPSSDLRGALPPVKETHLAAITDPQKAVLV